MIVKDELEAVAHLAVLVRRARVRVVVDEYLQLVAHRLVAPVAETVRHVQQVLPRLNPILNRNSPATYQYLRLCVRVGHDLPHHLRGLLVLLFPD